MNWLGLIVAVLQAGAGIEAMCGGDWRRALIYGGFAVGSAAIAWR